MTGILSCMAVNFLERKGERRGVGVALHVRKQMDSIKLYSGADKRVNSLWERIKGQANMGDTVVGAYL